MQHETHHTPHTSQVLGLTPGDEGTNDYFATIRPIGFAVYFTTHTTQDTPHTTHTHTPQVIGWTPSDEGTTDYSATILPYVSPCISGHTTQDTPHTTHTHTHHMYLGEHHATKAPTTLSRLFGP